MTVNDILSRLSKVKSNECNAYTYNTIQFAIKGVKKIRNSLKSLQSENDTLKAKVNQLRELESQQIVNCALADRQGGKCLGYSRADYDDEPCEMCKHCKQNSAYESEVSGDE